MTVTTYLPTSSGAVALIVNFLVAVSNATQVGLEIATPSKVYESVYVAS